MEYILHLDQKASQAEIYKRNELQTKKHNLQDDTKHESKHLANNILGVTAFLLITYIYIKGRVSLDTQ